MIVYSTPSSITWQLDTHHRITFLGEWTLEPKFYLNVPKVVCWDDSDSKKLAPQELVSALASLQVDAKNKGWILVINTQLSES